jgi:hypothetical protein
VTKEEGCGEGGKRCGRPVGLRVSMRMDSTSMRHTADAADLAAIVICGLMWMINEINFFAIALTCIRSAE